MSQSSVPAPLAPSEELALLTGGYFLSRCLQVVAELGVADALGEQPSTASTLATATGAHTEALARVLNLLCTHGVFTREDGQYAHNAASRLLRSDDPHSMRSFVRMFGLNVFWSTAELLDKAVRTGDPVLNDVSPNGLWDYFAQHPPAARIFNEAMGAKAHAVIPGIVAGYDFSQYSVIGDVGGGNGHLLRQILESFPDTRGVLVDLPHVIEQAPAVASDRLQVRSADFFCDELPTCDAYILMEVIHDWPDTEAQAILHAVRRAAPKHAKLLLIEAPIPDEPGPRWTKTLDVVMLAVLGGSQRTTAQYRELLARTGFQLRNVIDVGATYFILEAGTV